MARQQSSGAAGAIVGLVIFAFLWVITLVLAILWYSQLEEARKGQTEAEAELAKYIRPPDKNADVAALLQSDGNQTLTAKMFDRIERYRTHITGEPTKNIEAIETMMADLDTELQRAGFAPNATKTGLETVTRDLLKNYQAERDKALANAALVQEKVEEIKRLGAQSAATAQAFEQGVDAQKDLNLEQKRGYDQDLTYRQQQHGDLARQLEEVRQQMTALTAAQEQEKDQLLEKIREQGILIDRYRGTLQGGIAPEAWREPDGRITGLSEDGQYAFINLGYRQKVLPGMTFEVFDPETGIQADEAGVLRGVGTLELTKVKEATTVARIVRLENRDTRLREGDLVANVVYDANRTYKFHVFGDFDIDRTGQPSTTDRRRVEAMVQNYGGELAEDLTFDVDFLVLGVEPELPDPLPEGTFDPVEIARHASEMKKFTRYQELIGKATELKIPVLNQNRFLSLVGYYRR